MIWNEDLTTFKKHYNIPDDDFELLDELFVKSYFDKLYPEGRVGDSSLEEVRAIFNKES